MVLPEQASELRSANGLLTAKVRRLQDIVMNSRPREEGLIHTIAELEQVPSLAPVLTCAA